MTLVFFYGFLKNKCLFVIFKLKNYVFRKIIYYYFGTIQMISLRSIKYTKNYFGESIFEFENYK